ncbi:retinoic acid receptor RXR-beta-like [Mustela putorius furo]|uniref:Retinoic acid receptor RXR-beta-like n=1 Tax=Mustela putorius furo TaxID=9669 RepID=A0A8U0NNQ5_MUSPF|nr:retinoic acid receptor RXR-beta-like [Mustela putorius furo]
MVHRGRPCVCGCVRRPLCLGLTRSWTKHLLRGAAEGGSPAATRAKPRAKPRVSKGFRGYTDAPCTAGSPQPKQLKSGRRRAAPPHPRTPARRRRSPGASGEAAWPALPPVRAPRAFQSAPRRLLSRGVPAGPLAPSAARASNRTRKAVTASAGGGAGPPRHTRPPPGRSRAPGHSNEKALSGGNAPA